MQAIQCQVWGKRKLTHDDMQDLEEIEEWNEYGELRMQVNNVQALDSFPDPTTTASSAAGTPTAEGGAQSTTQPAAPKQSTIKIQSPPSKQESKDSSVSLAMRQASEEAAAKAKENKSNAINKPAAASAATSAAATAAAPTSSGAGPTEKEQPEKKQPEKQQPEKQQPESESATTSTTATTAPTTTTDKQGDDSVRRKSIIGEIAGEVRRPKLVPEDAAVSSANLHADYPTALRGHHRTSIVSATSKEERDQVAQDLRKSISGGNEEMLSSLRKGHGHSNSNGDDQEVRTIETIPQDPFEDEE